MTAEGLGRVLVTGGTGFIGSHVVRALHDAGAEVCALDIAPARDESAAIIGDGVPFEQGAADDWTVVVDAVSRFEPDRIVHLAAIGDPAVTHRAPFRALEVNVRGTLNILEAARIAGVQRVVNFSSIGVLPRLLYEPVDGSHPVLLADEGPGSGAYGASKIAGEAFCFAYGKSYGLDVATVRPSAVYGLGMRHPIFIKPMVEGAVRGQPVRLASGATFPRDYTHVADVASLTLAILRAPELRDRIFYAATGRPLVTGAGVAEAVRQVVPGADIEIADALTEADELERRARGVLSVENARTQLGWEPRYVDIVDGVREYAASYSAYLAA